MDVMDGLLVGVLRVPVKLFWWASTSGGGRAIDWLSVAVLCAGCAGVCRWGALFVSVCAAGVFRSGPACVCSWGALVVWRLRVRLGWRECCCWQQGVTQLCACVCVCRHRSSAELPRGESL